MRSRRAVKGGVGEIDVFGIHFLLAQPQALAKALEVDDLPLPQEADDVVYVGIIAETQDVIVCDAGFLFWCDSVRTTLDETGRGKRFRTSAIPRCNFLQCFSGWQLAGGVPP